jgi:DNA-directed RNA polymerase specialized sigma subunit
MRQNTRMVQVVMDRPELELRWLEAARCLPHFDRMVLQLRWADGLTRPETAAVLACHAAQVLAAELRLMAWLRRTTALSQS